MKRAIVLCGGGSRGAYELGVWRALREEGLEYHIVTGTSIGALNGALMAQKDFENASMLWDTLTVNQVMAGAVSLEHSITAAFKQKKEIKEFLKKYISYKGADITPLWELLQQVIFEERVRASDVDFGLVTVRFPSLKPAEMTLSMIPEGKLREYLLASASCFPAFPVCKIDGLSFIDGGYYDNLPIDLAVKMGAEEIIAVDLSFGDPSHPRFLQAPQVTYIAPSWSLGSFLYFDHDVMAANAALGYNDGRKTFGRLQGFRYSFQPENESTFEEISRDFTRRIALFEANLNAEKRDVRRNRDNDPLTSKILNFTGGKKLTHYEFMLRGAEIAAEVLQLDYHPVYTVDEFIRLLVTRIGDVERFSSTLLPLQLLQNDKPAEFYNKLKSSGREYLLGSILYRVLGSEPFYENLFWMASILPRELIAAIFLASVFSNH